MSSSNGLPPPAVVSQWIYSLPASALFEIVVDIGSSIPGAADLIRSRCFDYSNGRSPHSVPPPAPQHHQSAPSYPNPSTSMPQQWNTPGPQMSMMPPQPHRSARAILLSNHEHGMYRKIFVKNISFDTNEDTLRRYFERFGHIEDVVIVYDRAKKKSRGYGFVLYFDKASALRALRPPVHMIDGRETEASLAVPERMNPNGGPANPSGYPSQDYGYPMDDPRDSFDSHLNALPYTQSSYTPQTVQQQMPSSYPSQFNAPMHQQHQQQQPQQQQQQQQQFQSQGQPSWSQSGSPSLHATVPGSSESVSDEEAWLSRTSSTGSIYQHAAADRDVKLSQLPNDLQQLDLKGLIGFNSNSSMVNRFDERQMKPTNFNNDTGGMALGPNSNFYDYNSSQGLGVPGGAGRSISQFGSTLSLPQSAMDSTLSSTASSISSTPMTASPRDPLSSIYSSPSLSVTSIPGDRFVPLNNSNLNSNINSNLNSNNSGFNSNINGFNNNNHSVNSTSVNTNYPKGAVAFSINLPATNSEITSSMAPTKF